MSKKTNTAFAVLVGAAIGASIGILFAPDKGVRTRGKIKGNFLVRRDELLEKIGQLSGQLNLPFSPSEVLQFANETIDDGKNASEEIIQKLEQKLRELKTAASQLGNK